MMSTLAGSRMPVQELLRDVRGSFRAVVTATEPGVTAGLGLLDPEGAGRAVGRWRVLTADGQVVSAGKPLVEVVGTAAEIAAAEDHVLGVLGTAGGIARRSRELVASAPPGLRIACGGWKKLPSALKPVLRAGLQAAGVTPRLVDGEFVYVDKNVVRLVGGVAQAVTRARQLDHGAVAVQVGSVGEARAAVVAGAAIIMVDTGQLTSLSDVHEALVSDRSRSGVVLAYAGGVGLTDLDAVRAAGADVVDLGRAIIDAPLWDLHLTDVRPER